LGKSQYAQDLYNFSQQKLTNVKGADRISNLLKGYYEKQLAKVKNELKQSKEKLISALKAKNAEAKQVADDYKKLLFKREKYRMQTYGFNWTETGWINIDKGTIPKTWGPQRLEIKITNGKAFDRIYTYVVYTSIKSLYRLNSTDSELFYVGNEDEKSMLMPKKSKAVAIAIGYKGEIPSLAISEFETGNKNLNLTLLESNLADVKKAINKFEDYEEENRIAEDLVYMEKFFVEKKRQKELLKEKEFIGRLYGIAFPCCNQKPSPARYEEAVF
jgi:hypothetical protein